MTGRFITDTIIVPNEVVHFFKGKTREDRLVAVKLDITKAYDKMEWNYLETVMKAMDFDDKGDELCEHGEI